MKRPIFVGSSTEALGKAKHVCEVLSSEPNTEARLWTEIFEPGFLTFEALESMLNQCCAAVFIASPDDECKIGNRVIRSPRANILLEFGLVAGRLGHHSVAVCEYEGAELPSDLKGLTVIKMDPPDAKTDAELFRKDAEARLKLWSSRLLATPERVPRTDIVHGYSGRWDMDISLHKWRDLPVEGSSYVQVKGHMDLTISANGQAGRGLAHGKLQFKLPEGAPGTRFYIGEYRTAHEVMNVVCLKDGSLELTTQAFALQRSSPHIGTPPPQLEQLDLLPEPWSAYWNLSPNPNRPGFEGVVRTEGSILSEGRVKMTRREPL